MDKYGCIRDNIGIKGTKQSNLPKVEKFRGLGLAWMERIENRTAFEPNIL